jgi:hypothetical protein
MVAATIVVCALALTMASVDPPEVDPTAFHVRGADSLAREWLRIGAAESPTFRGLLARLVTSDVIVYITVVRRINGGSAGRLLFVAAMPPVRYLRIELAAGGSEREMVALAAHELQHAVEIAAAPGVRDSQSLALLYLSMSENKNRFRYDSAAARLIQERVRSELADCRDGLGMIE